MLGYKTPILFYKYQFRHEQKKKKTYLTLISISIINLFKKCFSFIIIEFSQLSHSHQLIKLLTHNINQDFHEKYKMLGSVRHCFFFIYF